MNEDTLLPGRGSVRRFAAWWATALVLTTVATSLLHAQISEEDRKKRDAFLKAREEMHTVASPSPSKSASPAAKPKPAKKKGKSSKTASPAEQEEPEPTKTAGSKKRGASDDDEEEDAPKAGKRSPAETTTGRRAKSPAARAEGEATPRGKATAAPTADAEDPAPLPRATPPLEPSAAGTEQPPADITIQKSGFEQEQGFEPPPPPPPRRGFFARLFGGGRERSYRYLNRGVIEAIRRAPVQRSRWKFVIVHNSGTRQGNAKAFDYYHKRVRKMQNGMAYHFVVGNGTSSGDGQIEIGDRWRRQINGGHVHSDYLNNISLGICLVGDFNRHQPTRAQLEATEELTKYLRERCGKVEGRAMGVRPHREMNPPRWATDCPGDAFPYGWFRRF